MLPSYTFGEDEFYTADGAPEAVAAKRKAGFLKLADEFKMGPNAQAEEAKLRDGFSDIRFTDTNRVPFPFQKIVQSTLKVRGHGQSRVQVQGGSGGVRVMKKARPRGSPHD